MVVHRITISRDSGERVRFDPPVLAHVLTGDSILWINNDHEAHWPGLKGADGSINKTFFMNAPLIAGSTSGMFQAGEPGTLRYACSMQGHGDEEGLFVIPHGVGGGEPY
jgi:plastocyanin